jgi:hypothetical protein
MERKEELRTKGKKYVMKGRRKEWRKEERKEKTKNVKTRRRKGREGGMKERRTN